MTTTSAPPRPTGKPERPGFKAVVRAEWTKFRTVRGWVVGLLVATVLCAMFTFLVANGSHEGGCTGPPPPGSGPNSPGSNCYTGHPFVPTGPDGEAVADSYYFLNQAVTGNATITAQISSLTGVISTTPANVASSQTSTRPGLAAWAKAGILLTPSTNQGSAYAAVTATGSQGVRWQYDYTHDSPGLPGSMTDTSPRWLRLTRNGDALTGYDSTNGTIWTQIGTTSLAGLPATVTVGLFVTSPVSFQDSNSGSPTLATATFDHVSIESHGGAGASDAWRGQSIGNGSASFYPTLGSGSYHRSGNAYVVSGSGDIAPGVGEGLLGADTAASILPLGLIVGLIVMIVLATMFITTEYRRGLIRITFTATPNRGRVLAAKAVVIGAIAFVTGAVAAAAAVPLGEHILTANGNYVFPAGTLTELRVIVGSGAVVALTAVAVMALGTILRNSAGAVTAGIVVFALPYVIGSFLSGSAVEWLYRLTPAAGFSVLQTLPHSHAGELPVHLRERVLPARPVGRPCRPRCLRRARPGRGRHLVAPQGRMIEALHAEWTKLRTLAGTGWLLIGTVALTVAVSAAVAATIHVTADGGQDPTKLSLAGIDLGQAVVVVFAVITISDEYGSGMIRVTLSAVPRRLILLVAKAANVAGLVLLAGLFGVAGCLAIGRLMLPSGGLNPAHGYALVSIGDGSTLRAAVGSVIYLVLIALLSLGVATVIRDTAVSIGAVLGLLFIPPILAQAVSDPLRQHLLQLAPMPAGLASQATTNLGSLPIAPWAGLGVLAAWAIASLLIGGLLLRRRDA